MMRPYQNNKLKPSGWKSSQNEPPEQAAKRYKKAPLKGAGTTGLLEAPAAQFKKAETVIQSSDKSYEDDPQIHNFLFSKKSLDTQRVSNKVSSLGRSKTVEENDEIYNENLSNEMYDGQDGQTYEDEQINQNDIDEEDGECIRLDDEDMAEIEEEMNLCEFASEDSRQTYYENLLRKKININKSIAPKNIPITPQTQDHNQSCDHLDNCLICKNSISSLFDKEFVPKKLAEIQNSVKGLGQNQTKILNLLSKNSSTSQPLQKKIDTSQLNLLPRMNIDDFENLMQFDSSLDAKEIINCIIEDQNKTESQKETEIKDASTRAKAVKNQFKIWLLSQDIGSHRITVKGLKYKDPIRLASFVMNCLQNFMTDELALNNFTWRLTKPGKIKAIDLNFPAVFSEAAKEKFEPDHIEKCDVDSIIQLWLQKASDRIKIKEKTPK